MVYVSPTRRARDVRVAVRAGCGGGATHCPVLAQLCADSRWRVGGANCGGVGGASYVRNLVVDGVGGKVPVATVLLPPPQPAAHGSTGEGPLK